MNWPSVPLEEVVALQRGIDLPGPNRRPGPYPVVSAGGVVGTHAEGPVEGPGVAIGRATNLGRPTWVATDYWPLNTTLYVKDFKGNDPRFVYRLFQSLDLTGFDSGSVQAMLNRNYIARVPVPLPPLRVQRAIAEVLGAFDDKIAANTRLTRMLDELRRLRFSSMLDGQSAPLSSLARFVNGRAYTKDATGTGRVVIRIAELNSGLGGSTVYNDIEVPEDNVARPGDLLFAWSGSLTAARWYRPEAIVNQHIFKVIPNQGWPLWLVACAVHRKLEDFKAIAADKATTMGHIQRHHLDESVGVPDAGSIAAIDAEMSALWSRALAAEVESLKLAELRDALLPRLMSGRITVREAEKAVEEVL